MAPVIKAIEELGSFVLGEGPHWDEETQSLYFVDLMNKTINKYVPSLKKHTYMQFDKTVSFIIPVTGSSDRFVISANREIAVLTWDGNNMTPTNIQTIIAVDTQPGFENNTLNDGKADPLGNLWAGTMSTSEGILTKSKGSLYSLDSTGQLKCQETKVSLSNGLAWSKDLTKMYYNDSLTKRVDQYDFDSSTLTITNRQPLFTFAKHGIPGIPDGQTIDADDNLWVAAFQAGRVLKISTKTPEVLLETITMPDWQITSVAFGGPNLDELYVTSGNGHWTNEDVPLHGRIYKVTGLGVKGLPANRVNITV